MPSFLIPALVTRQSAEFLHCASPTVREEAGAVAVPAVEITKASPMRVAAVRTDVDDTFFWAVDIAADVMFHDLWARCFHRGGYGESVSKPKRLAISGYLASSRAKFFRACADR